MKLKGINKDYSVTNRVYIPAFLLDKSIKFSNSYGRAKVKLDERLSELNMRIIEKY